MKQPFAIIIQGTSGAGKTTVSRLLSIKLRAVYLESDYFVMGMIPYRPVEDTHVTLGTKNYKECLERFIEAGENIVLDGVLVNDERSVFDIDVAVADLQQRGYCVHRFKLITDYDVARARMEERDGWDGHTTVVDRLNFERITDALMKEVPIDVPVVPTDGMTTEQVVEEVVTRIRNK